jgi:hypothetical protein
LIVRLHVINGFEKDCLLLERQGRFALVDGGSAGTFEHHLQPYLQQQLGTAGTLDAVIVSARSTPITALAWSICSPISSGHGSTAMRAR